MRALFDQRFEACATVEVLAEYHLALHSRSVRSAAEQVKLHPNSIIDFERAISESIVEVPPGPAFYVEDVDDVKFTAASTGSRAQFLVTSDAELLVLGTVLEAEVVTPERFMEVLDG